MNNKILSKKILSKKALAIALSKLESFKSPKVSLEQYSLSSELAATLLWIALLNGNIKGNVIVDLGAGTGILGIGALLLGAKKVYFVDCDSSALDITQKNLNAIKSEVKIGEYELIQAEVSDFQNNKIDTVIQNPPFGTKKAHADKEFLEKAFSLAKSVYSVHKSNTSVFLEAISRDHNYVFSNMRVKEILKKTYKFHKKKAQYIDIILAYFRAQ